MLFGHAPNCQHRKSETDVVRKRRVGQQHGGRDHIVLCILHLEICFGRASATYQEHKQVFRLDVDGVFVWSLAHVHELSRHRALRLRIACGYLRFCARLFSLFLWKRVLAAVSSCSCLWQSLLSAVRRLNSMPHLLSLSFIADAEGDHLARVRECECAGERVFLWVFVFACAYLRCFVVLELMS